MWNRCEGNEQLSKYGITSNLDKKKMYQYGYVSMNKKISMQVIIQPLKTMTFNYSHKLRGQKTTEEKIIARKTLLIIATQIITIRKPKTKSL